MAEVGDEEGVEEVVEMEIQNLSSFLFIIVIISYI